MKNKILKWSSASLIILILLITTFTSYIYSKQEKIIFAATQLPSDYSSEFDRPFEEINLTTEDNVNLNGIHFKVPKPKGVILYFHGNAGDLSRWGNIASYFTSLQYNVLVVDYRTYGKSTGVVNEQKMLEDTQLWYNHLQNTYKESDIIIYGRSIGTGFATYAASKNNPRKLVLETPFYNLLNLAKRKFSIIPFLEKLMTIKLESNIYITNVKAPIIIYHGMKDRIVPYDSGVKLSELVNKNQLTFHTIPEANHHNIASFKLYQDTIKASLALK